MLLTICAMVCTLIYFTYRFLDIQLSRYGLSAIPQPPVASLIHGHGKMVTRAKFKNRYLDQMRDWTNKYGATIVLHFTGRHFFFTADPLVLRDIATDLKCYRKARGVHNRQFQGQKIVGYNSILSGNGTGWAVKRRSMSHYFAKANMRDIFDAAKPHMEGPILNKWKALVQDGPIAVDLIELLSTTFESYVFCLGFDKLEHTPEEIGFKINEILDAFMPLKTDQEKRLILRYFFNEHKTRVIKTIQSLRSDIKQAVIQRFEELSAPDTEIKSSDMLGHLMEANKTNGERKCEPHEQVEGCIDDAMTVLMVMDNMTKQLAALFLFLSDCPEIQEKMFGELREIPVEKMSDLNNLVYTEKCLLEALRKGPALRRGIRKYMPGLSESGKLGNYRIPESAGSISIWFSEYVMHHNPIWWPEPEVFDPERWQPDFVPEPYSYIPFYVGARSCLAKHMAMMLMKLTLSGIAKNFDIIPAWDGKRKPIISQIPPVLRMNNNLTMEVSAHTPPEMTVTQVS